MSAFWSPDGKSLGFFADDKLKRIDLPGTTAVVLCPTLNSSGYTGSWGRDGRILFASLAAGSSIMAVSSAGGVPVEERKVDASQGERQLQSPHFLPDGRHYLYLSRDKNFAGRLMLAAGGEAAREVMQVQSNVQYADPGYLMFVREGTLLAQRFDATTGLRVGRSHCHRRPRQLLQQHRQRALLDVARRGRRLPVALGRGAPRVVRSRRNRDPDCHDASRQLPGSPDVGRRPGGAAASRAAGEWHLRPLAPRPAARRRRAADVGSGKRNRRAAGCRAGPPWSTRGARLRTW